MATTSRPCAAAASDPSAGYSVQEKSQVRPKSFRATPSYSHSIHVLYSASQAEADPEGPTQSSSTSGCASAQVPGAPSSSSPPSSSPNQSSSAEKSSPILLTQSCQAATSAGQYDEYEYDGDTCGRVHGVAAGTKRSGRIT